MGDRLAAIEDRLAGLEDEVRRLHSRLDRGAGDREAALPAEQPAYPTEETAAAPRSTRHPPRSEPAALGLIGRALVALGVGFLIRALTGGGYVPGEVGVALGLAYAVLFVAWADRSAARGEHTGATIQGLTGALLAYPLLFEAATRFRILAPAGMALLAVAFLAGAAVIASRRRLALLGWLATTATVGVLVGLLLATRDLLAVTVGLLAAAAVVEWTSAGPASPRWVTAIAADLGVFVLLWLVGRPAGLPPGYPAVGLEAALLVAIALPVVFFARTAIRTLAEGAGVGPFEVLQGALALALGFGGALRLLAGRPSTALLALGGLALGVTCYWAAYTLIERRHGQTSAFHFYAAAGGVLTLFATFVLLGRRGTAVVWCGLAVLMAALGARFDRTTLRHHAGGYLLAASLAAGLAPAATRALLGGAVPDGPLDRGLHLVLVATGALVGLLLADRHAAPGWRRDLPGLVPAAVAAWGLGGLLALGLASSVASSAGGAALATLRTAVLSLLAAGVAEGSRWAAAPRALRWLVYPILAAAGVKLLIEDLPLGEPVTQFLSFACYGAALIWAPRRLREAAPPDPPAAS